MTPLTFLVAAIVLAVTPGPGIAYVVACNVAGGRSEGLASCIGTGIGGLLHVLAAAVGLSLLVAEPADAFGVVKYLGAAYLVFLDIRMLLRMEPALGGQAVASRGVRRALFEGVVVEPLNVKTALFFLAFLPQFTTSSAASSRNSCSWAAFASRSTRSSTWRPSSPPIGCSSRGPRGRAESA